MPVLSHLHPLFNADTCHAYLHTLRWKNRPLQCPRCHSQNTGPWGTYPYRPGLKRYRCRACRRTSNDLTQTRSPNLNAHCERFVRSIKEEALEQMVMLGERALYYAIHQYLAHYHTERNHQGLGNQRITPEPERSHQGGAVVRRDRLGGLLSYYYRDAA